MTDKYMAKVLPELSDPAIAPGTALAEELLDLSDPENMAKVKPKSTHHPKHGAPYPQQITEATDKAQDIRPDLTNTMLEFDILDMDELSSEEFTLARRDGLGGSDGAVLLGVSPYSTSEELIQEKLTKGVTDKERAIGMNPAVITGNDLESLIIHKHELYFGNRLSKPTDQFRHKNFPFLKVNYDGIFGSPKQYYPTETKVVTYRGEKNYHPEKAIFREGIGYFQLPENVAHRNWSVQNKAYHYGIPVNYYIQLQVQLMGFNAPYGYISALFESKWLLYTFLIWSDPSIQNAVIIQGQKLWEKILSLRGETYAEYVARQPIHDPSGDTEGDADRTSGMRIDGSGLLPENS